MRFHTCRSLTEASGWLEKVCALQVSQSRPTLLTKLKRRFELDWLLGDFHRFLGIFFKKNEVFIEGVCIPGVRFYPPAIQTELYSKRYEGAELSFLREALMPDDSVLELGGGLGLLSSWCGNKVSPNKVWVVEANPAQVKKIQELHRGMSQQIQVISGAVGNDPDGKGTIDFFFGKNFWDASTVKDESNLSLRSLKVPIVDFAKLLQAKNPSVLICDIEGAEFDLFENISGVKLESIRLIVLEVHSQKFDDAKVQKLLSYFLTLGFSVQHHHREPHVWRLQRQPLSLQSSI